MVHDFRGLVHGYKAESSWWKSVVSKAAHFMMARKQSRTVLGRKRGSTRQRSQSHHDPHTGTQKSALLIP